MIAPSDSGSQIPACLSPGNFFVAPGGSLRIEHLEAQTIAWEFFHGHLLDETQTRERRTFETWCVFLDEANERAATPLASVHLDADGGAFHVTRNILIHGHEVVEATPGVLETQPALKWLREFVGSVSAIVDDSLRESLSVGHSLRECPDDSRSESSTLAASLATLLSKAFFGGSRLPVASHESPLPATTLGKIAYFEPADGTLAVSRCGNAFGLIDAAYPRLTLPRQARRLEMALRASSLDDVPQLAAALGAALADTENPAADAARIIAELFRQLALTPYQPLAGKLAALLRALAADECLEAAAVIHVICNLLRPLTRHLTAFDLKTFHNFGSDYPDLLLLDDLLKLLHGLLDQCPAAFLSEDPAATRNRSAHLQALLARKRYEALPVPGAPTSPGDNQRVWPAELPRARDEAIFDPRQRTTRLFDGDSLEVVPGSPAAAALALALQELSHPAALRELGTALFLDRPLGAAKPPGEIDRTPLLSYVAFSPAVAIRRLAELARLGWIDAERQRALTRDVQALNLPGYALDVFHGRPRPGVATLADAPLVSPDFLFLWTTRSSLDEFLACFDLGAMHAAAPDLADWLTTSPRVLLIRTSPWPPAARDDAPLTAFDEKMQPRLKLRPRFNEDGSLDYRESLAVELPRDGLDVIWPIQSTLSVRRL